MYNSFDKLPLIQVAQEKDREGQILARKCYNRQIYPDRGSLSANFFNQVIKKLDVTGWLYTD